MTTTFGGAIRRIGSGQIHAGETNLHLTYTGIPRNGTVTGVIYCHSRGNTGLEPVSPTSLYDYQKVCKKVVQAGLPMVAADLGGTDTWGNDTAISRVSEAFTWMQSRLGVRSDRLLLFGQSMGAMLACNFAKANPSLVRAVAAMFPALDQDDSGLSGYLTGMNTAYTDSATRIAAKPTHNPATYAASLSTPVHLLYSTGDTVARPSVVTTFAATAPSVTTKTISSAGAHVTATITDAEAQTVVDFLTAHA